MEQNEIDALGKFIAENAAPLPAAPAPTDEQDELPQPMRVEFERPHGLMQLEYYTAAQMRQQRQEGRRDMHETNITLVGENCKLSEEVAKLRAALAARQAPAEVAKELTRYTLEQGNHRGFMIVDSEGLWCRYFDARQVSAPDATTEQKALEAKLKSIASQNARKSIELQIIEDLIDDPEHEYDCGTEADYTTPLTDKVNKFVKEARAARQVAPDAGIDARDGALEEVAQWFEAHPAILATEEECARVVRALKSNAQEKTQ